MRSLPVSPDATVNLDVDIDVGIKLARSDQGVGADQNIDKVTSSENTFLVDQISGDDASLANLEADASTASSQCGGARNGWLADLL